MESLLVDWLAPENARFDRIGAATVPSLEKCPASLKHDAGSGTARFRSRSPPKGSDHRGRLAGPCKYGSAHYAFAPPSSCDLFRREVQILAQYSKQGEHCWPAVPWTKPIHGTDALAILPCVTFSSTFH